MRDFRGWHGHTAMIAIVLLLTLGVAGVLAYQAQQAARSHRATAENVLREYARFASWELARLARRTLYDALGQHLARLGRACPPVGSTGKPIARLPALEQWAQGKDG